MSNKTRAVTCTASKTIINVDLALEILDKGDMGQLNRIIDKLVEYDNQQKIARKTYTIVKTI